MIKGAIDRILELASPNMFELNGGEDYSDKKLYRIDKELRASAIEMNTLKSLVRYIQSNAYDFKKGNYIVQVVSPTFVRLLSSLDADRKREILVEVEAELPSFPFNKAVQHQEFLIGVQAKFVDGDAAENDKALILRFAGTVKSGTVANYKDDGVSQKATIKTGVASLSEAEVPSPCRLKPFRTFLEVDQPLSSFIFRLDENGAGITCALYEADGGAWKIAAKDNIRAYLEEQLKGKDNIIVIS